MTCIAVLRNKRGKLVFASDRRVTDGSKATILPVSKTIQRDGYILAGAGSSFLSSKILLTAPLPPVRTLDVYKHMFQVFLPEFLQYLRDCCVVHPSENRLNSEPSPHNPENEEIGSFLIGINGYLFELDLTPTMLHLDIASVPNAIGCGAPFALGSLYTTEGSKMTTKARLVRALTIAAKINPNCDDNIDITSE
jgi:hypothetical protein